MDKIVDTNTIPRPVVLTNRKEKSKNLVKENTNGLIVDANNKK